MSSSIGENLKVWMNGQQLTDLEGVSRHSDGLTITIVSRQAVDSLQGGSAKFMLASKRPRQKYERLPRFLVVKFVGRAVLNTQSVGITVEPIMGWVRTYDDVTEPEML